MVCSVWLPSVASNDFHSRWAAYDDSVKAMPLILAAASSAASRSAILRLERDREGVLDDRRLERPVSRRSIVEDRRPAQRRGAGAGDPDGFGGHAVRLGGGQDVRRGEAPRAVDEDADTEALALTRSDALDPAGLDRDALLEPSDDADVGVSRTQRRGGVEGPIGHVAHAPRSLAEGSLRCGLCPR